MDLTEKKCVPCRGGIPPMGKDQACRMIEQAPGWTLSEDGTRISRLFVFKDFKEAMAFVNRVADLSEEEGHHPDFEIHWNKVGIVLFTHKIKGLHENDFILAAKINRLTPV